MNLKAIPKMLAMIPAVFTGVDLRDLERIKAITREAYPTVPQLGTAALAERMENSVSSMLLVDVRTPEEFVVSHLRGALNMPTLEQISKEMAERKPSTTILYCSVGFRSSRLAYRLARLGLGDVQNLEGSIFQWANEGRALFQGAAPAQLVHPYGKRWTGLLKQGLASDC